MPKQAGPRADGGSTCPITPRSSASSAEVAAHFGRLDILINNAGFGGFSPLGNDDYDLIWDRTIAGLLTAQQRMVRAALVHLRKSDAARIVNIASTEGLGATPGDSPYAVAKTGVIGLTRALAVDFGTRGNYS